MKRRIDSRHFIALMIAIATVFSFGIMTSADEIELAGNPDEQEISSEDAVAAEEDIVTEDDEDIILDVSDVIADEEIAEENDEDESVVADCDTEDEDVVSFVVEEAAVTEEASNAYTGWQENEGKWVYYVDGNLITGWKYIDGNWYYFNIDSSVMCTGLLRDPETDEYYVLGIKGQMLKGWQQYNGYWYYLDNNGKAVRGWKKIGGKWYFFNTSKSNNPYMFRNTITQIESNYYIFSLTGEMLTGWIERDDRWYYADKSTGIITVGWKQIGGKWYYFNRYMYSERFLTYEDENGNIYNYRFDDNGAMGTGWYYSGYYDSYEKEYVDGRWYYFDSAGRSASGWTKINNKWYFFDPSAYNCPYLVQDGIVKARDGNGEFGFYAVDENGVMITGWYNSYVYVDEDTGETVYAGSWYYFDKNTGKAVSGWKQLDGKWYYFYQRYASSAPYMLSSTMQKILDETGTPNYYRFSESGVMITGWYNTNVYVSPKTGKTYYDGTWYYFGADGKAYTGWHKINGNYYYFYNSENGNPYMCTSGLVTIDDELYYLDPETGVCFTGGWLDPKKSGSSSWYYFNSNGKAATGWKQLNGQWYYFGQSGESRHMRIGINNIEGKKYLFGESGVMLKGWINYNGQYYYADSTGALVTGWQNIGGKIYCFDSSSSAMYTGLRSLNDVMYDFGQSGVCVNPPANVT